MNHQPNDIQPTPRDIEMMQLALDQARIAADLGEVPVGAVIYRHDDPGAPELATAHNMRESTADPTAHAEIIALRAAAKKLGSWRLDNCSIAVTLEPCPMCAGALINSRIARLVYGPPDPKMGCVETLHQLCTDTRFNHRLITIPNVLADQSAQLLSDFFKQRRNNNKPPKPKPQL